VSPVDLGDTLTQVDLPGKGNITRGRKGSYCSGAKKALLIMKGSGKVSKKRALWGG